MPADLARLDLAVPVGALDQPHHQPPPVLARQRDHPVAQRHGALLVGLQREAEALPAACKKRVVSDQRLDNVQRQFEPLGFLGIDGEMHVGIARTRRQFAQQRHQRCFRRIGMEKIVARIERRQLH